MNETYWFVGASYDAANDQPQVFTKFLPLLIQGALPYPKQLFSMARAASLPPRI